MSLQRLDLTARNNTDWQLGMYLFQPTGAGAPWQYAQNWLPAQVYQTFYPASIVVNPYGDIYVATGGVERLATFTSEDDWEADKGMWTVIGVASVFGSKTYDLSQQVVKMAIAKLDPLADPAEAVIAQPRRTYDIFTSDGSDPSQEATISILNATGGLLYLDVPKARSSKVPVGVYGYDMVAIGPGPNNVVTPLAYGLFTVLQGATP